MTLAQYHALKVWHIRHCRDRPLEKAAWDLVLMLWMCGWVGLPAALLVDAPLAFGTCGALLFLPGAYVALRRRLHRRGVLRCDWVTALR